MEIKSKRKTPKELEKELVIEEEFNIWFTDIQNEILRKSKDQYLFHIKTLLRRFNTCLLKNVNCDLWKFKRLLKSKDMIIIGRFTYYETENCIAKWANNLPLDEFHNLDLFTILYKYNLHLKNKIGEVISNVGFCEKKLKLARNDLKWENQIAKFRKEFLTEKKFSKYKNVKKHKNNKTKTKRLSYYNIENWYSKIGKNILKSGCERKEIISTLKEFYIDEYNEVLVLNHKDIIKKILDNNFAKKSLVVEDDKRKRKYFLHDSKLKFYENDFSDKAILEFVQDKIYNMDNKNKKYRYKDIYKEFSKGFSDSRYDLPKIRVYKNDKTIKLKKRRLSNLLRDNSVLKRHRDKEGVYYSIDDRFKAADVNTFNTDSVLKWFEDNKSWVEDGKTKRQIKIKFTKDTGIQVNEDDLVDSLELQGLIEIGDNNNYKLKEFSKSKRKDRNDDVSVKPEDIVDWFELIAKPEIEKGDYTIDDIEYDLPVMFENWINPKRVVRVLKNKKLIKIEKNIVHLV